MLRIATRRVGHLALWLREGSCYFHEGAYLYQGKGDKRYYTSVQVGSSLFEVFHWPVFLSN